MDYLSLCLICKDENDYLPEWLDYHIMMGVDRFYIYDNESQVSLRESLSDYVKRGWVQVVDIPGKAMQLYAYDHCLHTFGVYTRWMGFIDTDEFLVPKTTLDLKELLKDYEAYGGLAVSSLFFGSNGCKIRPTIGQIAAYTRRTHSAFSDNELIKSIVQPELVLMPNSPHSFTYKAGSWCVNEIYQRVDGQRFPNHVDKIQLNHYFCRSESEIELKLNRGNSQSVSWPRKRFIATDSLAIIEDQFILENVDILFRSFSIIPEHKMEESEPRGYLEKMAVLACARHTASFEATEIFEHASPTFRVEFVSWVDIKTQLNLAKAHGDFAQVSQILSALILEQPQYAINYINLAANYLTMNEPGAAWRELDLAWQIAPNSYEVLVAMSLYFLWERDFLMAEEIDRLILALVPGDPRGLCLLSQSLLGKNQIDDAIQVIWPLIQLSPVSGGLLEGIGSQQLTQMADRLLEKHDYARAVSLLDAGLVCRPDDVKILLALTQVLIIAGDTFEARKRLEQAFTLEPQNESLRAQIESVNVNLPTRDQPLNHKKQG